MSDTTLEGNTAGQSAGALEAQECSQLDVDRCRWVKWHQATPAQPLIFAAPPVPECQTSETPTALFSDLYAAVVPQARHLTNQSWLALTFSSVLALTFSSVL